MRTEEAPVRVAYPGLEDYERWVMEVGGPFAMVIRGLPDDERDAFRTQLAEAFGPFETGGGYVIADVALTVAAS